MHNNKKISDNIGITFTRMIEEILETEPPEYLKNELEDMIYLRVPETEHSLREAILLRKRLKDIINLF